LSQSLGLSRPLATTLARRGLTDPQATSGFLEGSEQHDPDLFEGMDSAVAETLAAVEAGRRVTVYGDFDVDGVSATAIMVTVLRQMGADCDWFIPDRISDGYGISSEAIRNLAGRGSGLVISVDCGVTSVEEVELAKSLGMGIIVTDHHRPGNELPDCTVLHPAVSSYPFVELCGAAVAAKFATGLRRRAGLDPALDEDDLDLVALATVADVMPLIGENRRLVKEGLRVARRAERPGMRALISECRLEPSRLSSEDFGFRLGPRINAAGRIYRADAGVELFLSESADRAAEIATELGRANGERRRIEREVEAEAEASRRELGEREPAALVLAGEGWHPGVVGIVAAKLSRRHGVPAVVLSVDGEAARGSARGIPGLDLYAAIDSVAGLLESFGGHAAAAGVQIRTERIPEFREALGLAVAEMTGSARVSRLEAVDAFAGGGELAMSLAEEIEKLEPCGKGNPSLTLLIPSARISDVQEIGGGKHCRFTVVSGGSRAAGISFGRTGFGVDEETPMDLLAELSVNHWNGSSVAQVRVRDAFALPAEHDAGDPSKDLPGCEPGEWWSRFDTALASGGGTLGNPAGETTRDPDLVVPGFDGPAEVVTAELISSGEPLLVVTADARRRWSSLRGSAGISRFRGGEPGSAEPASGLWAGSPSASGHAFGEAVKSGVGLTDYGTLIALREPVPECANVLLFDPPASGDERVRVCSGATAIYAATDPASLEFALQASADRHLLTPHLRSLYRELRDAAEASDAGEATGGRLLEALSGEGESARSPERAALLLGVLIEAGLARSEGSGDARSACIVSSGKVDLTDSPLFSKQERLHKEQVEFLRQSNR
jgi:single-stranded-DNA-specific exonuclease